MVVRMEYGTTAARFDRGTSGGYLVKEGRSICESDPFDAA